MGNVWLLTALWIGLALAAAVLSVRLTISVALTEIIVGAIAGNVIHLQITEWVNWLAGFGAILLTFLAGVEIDIGVVKRNLWSTMSIGLMGFFAPYLGIFWFAHFVYHWPWDQAQIAGIALSTTSVAVVYAVMVETGFNDTEIGKVILAACFVNDIGTVLALGLVFANYNFWLLGFATATVFALLVLPRITPWFFARIGARVSEPQIKFVLVILFLLGGLANTAKSEAVLPAYLVGMVLAPVFLADRELMHRTRVIAFTMLTPFYFLKAGSLVRADVIIGAAGLIVVYLAVKMITKFVGILPLTRLFRFERREGMYTTLMMSTGLTFGSISALFGLTNHIIDERQYTILLTAVIGSAVVPTLIAQRWFQPDFKPLAITGGDPESAATAEGK
ncbi:MAG: cation:proton antiporter [Alphaproteobacteria bacterium]|nr:cation:proton antiporter [Alphaproteobacteria bacterium]